MTRRGIITFVSDYITGGEAYNEPIQPV